MTVTAQDMVRREVHYCVSSLVHTLAKSAHGAIASPDHRNPYLNDAISETMRLCDQAAALAAPVLDYEEAAREAGWRFENAHGKPMWTKGGDLDEDKRFEPSAETACRSEGIEPYDREVFEHWIVSRWLGEKLADKGEKVDFDFAGITVWARTTTGRAICMDTVIQEIARELNQ